MHLESRIPLSNFFKLLVILYQVSLTCLAQSLAVPNLTEPLGTPLRRLFLGLMFVVYIIKPLQLENCSCHFCHL